MLCSAAPVFPRAALCISPNISDSRNISRPTVSSSMPTRTSSFRVFALFLLQLIPLPFFPLSFTPATSEDPGPIVILGANEGSEMPKVMRFGRWTGLYLKLLTRTVDGLCGTTSVRHCAVSVRCRMVVRGWFWGNHRPVADVQTQTVTCITGTTVTVLGNRTFWVVRRSFTAPVLVSLESEIASVKNCSVAKKKATSGA